MCTLSTTISACYEDTAFCHFPFFFLNPSLLLSYIFEHDCLDTYCFGCLIYKRFIFSYLHLFSAIEYVPLGKAL